MNAGKSVFGKGSVCVFLYVGVGDIEPRRQVFLDVGLRSADG